MKFLTRKVFGHEVWAWIVFILWIAILVWGYSAGVRSPKCNSNGDCIDPW